MRVPSFYRDLKKLFLNLRQKTFKPRTTDIPKIAGLDLKLLNSCDLVGSNWFKEEPLPIAILWGFNPWKRELMQPFLPNHKLAFVRGARGSFDFRNLTSYLPVHDRVEYFSWGYKMPWFVRMHAKSKGIALFFVEDGFLRSFNPGALHTAPHSLTIDKDAPYYDSHKTTTLKKMLRERSSLLSPEDLEAADAGMAIFEAAKLTKYYPLSPFPPLYMARPHKEIQTVLLIGQVESDQSIRFGASKWYKPYLNIHLYELAEKLFPNAYFIYRPHPDVFFNNRASKSERRLASRCTIVSPEIDLHTILEQCDHVVTATSLVGLEAMIAGVPVTVLGRPFYESATPNYFFPKAKPAVSLREMFAVAYLKYPLYVHPISREQTTFHDVASYLIVEKHKCLLSNVSLEPRIDILKLRENKEWLSIPANLFFELFDRRSAADVEPIDLDKFLGDEFSFTDVPQITGLLIAATDFKTLTDYAGRLTEKLQQSPYELTENEGLFTAVLNSIQLIQRMLRGRVALLVPNVNEWVTMEETNISSEFLLAYASVLSHNVQYDILGELFSSIEESCNRDKPLLNWTISGRISEALTNKPARSDREPESRKQLLTRGAQISATLLSSSKKHPICSLIDSAWIAKTIDNLADCEHYISHIINYNQPFDEDEENPKPRSEVDAELVNYINVIIEISGYLKRNSRDEMADRLLARIEGNTKIQDTLIINQLRETIETSNHEEFPEIYNKIPLNMREHIEVRDSLIRYLRSSNMQIEALKNVKDALNQNNISSAKRKLLFSAFADIEFSIEASRILNSIPQPITPRGVVLVASHTDLKSIAMLIPALVEVKKRGYAVVSLTNGTFEQTATGIDYIDNFRGMMDATRRTLKKGYSNEWHIDWNKKVVVSNGINFYQGFYESLANFFRKYDINLNEDAVRRSFYYRLMRADDSLEICTKVHREIARRGMPCIFLSGDSHIVPYSIFRDYCQAKQDPNLTYVSSNVGYENYFTNIGSRYSSTMAVADMTLFPEYRAPFLPRRDRFEKWYKTHGDKPQYQKRANELINMNRVSVVPRPKVADRLVQRISHARKTGKRIVCCLGKIPIDLGVPYDGGPAHADMRDWLNHTIKTLAGREDVVLLIKPHPHEIRPEIALDLLDGFTDLIEETVADNVWILDHQEINNHQLAPHLDLAIMWNGSSGLEFIAQGVPVSMSSYFGRFDYPVEMNYPESREVFEQFLCAESYPDVPEDIRSRAAYIIAYMETSDVSLPNDYALRPITNDAVGPPIWNKKRVNEFLAHGDPYMEEAAARILEKFEG